MPEFYFCVKLTSRRQISNIISVDIQRKGWLILLKYVDLHIHSSYSDGTDTPAELVQLALSLGLSAFALTDHDTTGGFAEAQCALMQAGAADRLRIIPGVEISAAYKDRDIHILGLFIDPGNEALSSALKIARENRIKRNRTMLQRLCDAGYPMTEAELVQDSDAACIGRMHFANALVARGYAKSKQDAFQRFIGQDCPYYVPRNYITPQDAIALIRGAGGLAILAHPLLYHLERPELEQLVARLMSCGLSGLEAIYTTNSTEDEQYVRTLASRNGLLISGGSDYHGANKPHITMGTGRGNLRIPESIVTTLEQARSR